MTSYEKAVKMQDTIAEYFGFEEAWEALCKALSVDEMIDNFEYIIRCYDVPYQEEDENDA